MSMKIFNGYKMDNISILNLYEFTQTIKNIYMDYCYDIYIKLFSLKLYQVTELLSYYHVLRDYNVYNDTICLVANEYKRPKYSINNLVEAFNIFEDNNNIFAIVQRIIDNNITHASVDNNEDYCFDSDIVVYPRNNYILFTTHGRYFNEFFDVFMHDDKYKDIRKQYNIRDYYYQNSTDKPDSIDLKDWKQRESDWYSVFDSISIPSNVGMCISILDSDTLIMNIAMNKFDLNKLFRYRFDEQLLYDSLKYIEDIELRLTKLAKNSAMKDYLDSKNKSNNLESSNITPSWIIKVYREFENLYEEGNAIIIQNVESYKSKINNIMIDYTSENFIADLFNISFKDFLDKYMSEI